MGSDRYADTASPIGLAQSESGLRVLVMTAVSAERDAVLRGLGGHGGFDVLLAGVGPIAAAAATVKALTQAQYDIVVSAGIGGGFEGRAEVGSLVVADKIIAADLGAETPEGYLSLDELGFGSSVCIPVDEIMVHRLTHSLAAAGLPVQAGSVLTVSTVTGTALTAAALSKRIPEAAAEAMEGYGVATAAHMYSLPVIEIRAISNPVGPRDRTAWRIKEALDILEAGSKVLAEVLR